MTNDVIKKCAGCISFLFRYSSLLDFYCCEIMCSALIVPYLDYVVSGPPSASYASFTATAIGHWNALPNVIKEKRSLPKFREKAKSYLMSFY